MTGSRLAAWLAHAAARPVAPRGPGWRRDVVELEGSCARALPSGYGAGSVPAEATLAADLALVRGRAAAAPLLFLDIETAMGPGVRGVPFVVGIARYDPARTRAMWIEQWVLERADAERSMLGDLAARLDALACGAALSFGGAAFDLPVLRGRMARLRLRCEALDDRDAHVDLLPVARRLWKRVLPDCRLATIERAVLGLSRIGDPSGAEVARIGGRWLGAERSEATLAELAAVQRHNRADLVTLPHLCRTLAQRLGEAGSAEEALGAAQHRLAIDDRTGGIEILRALVDAARSGAAGIERPGIEAALRLAALERKQGRRDASAALWSWVLGRRPGEPRASLALAKHLEHHASAPAAALRVASASLEPCPRRIARLTAKAARQAPRTDLPTPPAQRAV